MLEIINFIVYNRTIFLHSLSSVADVLSQDLRQAHNFYFTCNAQVKYNYVPRNEKKLLN